MSKTKIHVLLLAWYDEHRRAMPWRDHPDPYAVWVSEIMLQQTQVDTVRAYFIRFLKAFPTVRQLACAPQGDVLKAWEGLGYYTRARNLQKAAQQIVAGGCGFPRSAEAWSALPGIGPYTAAAIASISFKEVIPVVDGNVARVFARYLGWDDDFRRGPAREKLAAWLMPPITASGRPGDFNQAMMDLGATCCTPQKPVCPLCPLRKGCFACHSGRQDEFPTRPLKKTLPVRRTVAVRVVDSGGRVLLVQRVGETLLEGLWELPQQERAHRPTRRDAMRILQDRTGLETSTAVAIGVLEHVFSHFKQEMHVYEAATFEGTLRPQTAPVVFADPKELPLTTATRRALNLSAPKERALSASARSGSRSHRSRSGCP